MTSMAIRKKIDDGRLVFYCRRCGKVLYTMEDLDYAGTNACEDWEVELSRRHEGNCKPSAEWLEKVLPQEDIAKAKELAKIAKEFGENTTWEEVAAGMI